MTHSVIVCQWHNSTSELKMEKRKFGSKCLEDVKIRFSYKFGSNLQSCVN